MQQKARLEAGMYRVYVDDLAEAPVVCHFARVFAQPSALVCKLTADSNRTLVQFAMRIGIPMKSLRSYPLYHFELSSELREKALSLGANYVPTFMQEYADARGWNPYRYY